MENAIGGGLPRRSRSWESLLPEPLRLRLYRVALDRGNLDTYLADYLVDPLLRLFRWCDSMERKWTDFLSRAESRESDHVQPSSGTIDDLL
jgi:NAD(P)H-quinone oxidoreductase subunit 5